MNSTDVDGVYAIPTAVEADARVSAPRAYLTEAVRRRANLNLVTGTEATAILFEGRKAVGAAIRRANGSGDTLRANTIVVSAGAIHSPALLMRSGIGPADTLQTAGIAVLHEQNQLGRNLQNHPFLHLGAVIRPGMRQSPALRTYAISGARLSSGQKGAPAGDLFVSFIARTSGYANGNRLGMVGPSLYAPHSRGSVRLDPRRPHGEPLVDFSVLADPRDTERLLQAARFARTLLETRECARLPLKPSYCRPIRRSDS